MNYALHSTIGINKQPILFEFGTRKYNTKHDKYLQEMLPFRQDHIHKTICHPSKTMYNIDILHQARHQFVSFSKTMNTYTHNRNMTRIPTKDFIELDTDDNSTIKISLNGINVKEAKMVQYVNDTEIGNYSNGLNISKKQIIFIYYEPYNNGHERRFAIYINKHTSNLSISPLQMLWKIKKEEITLKELRKLSTMNKIAGRSKLKTYSDYLHAFMKL